MTAMPPVYRAERMHPQDKTEFVARGRHCEVTSCRQPVDVRTLRTFTRRGRRMSVEHFVCTEHGAEFAAQHKITIRPAPAEPGPAPGARRRYQRRRGGAR
jgi:hypothetical protein